MCKVCKSENRDWKFNNGKRCRIENKYLYKVFVGQVAVVQLCYLHSVELFEIGEQRFLKNHVNLALDLSVNKKEYTRMQGFSY